MRSSSASSSRAPAAGRSRTSYARRALNRTECYILGPYENRKRPDLAIEVMRRPSGIDKLEIYRRLGVAEVWFWIRGAIEVYVRGVPEDAAWRRVERSSFLPDLDLALLCSFLDRSSTTVAMREFRDALRR